MHYLYTSPVREIGLSAPFTDEKTKAKLVKGKNWHLNPGPCGLKPQALHLPFVSMARWSRGRTWSHESFFAIISHHLGGPSPGFLLLPLLLRGPASRPDFDTS